MKTIRLPLLLPVLLAGSWALAGCDVTSSDDHDDHLDPFGFVIDQNQAEIVRFQSNVFNWNPDGSWDAYYRDGVNGIVISPEVITLTQENPRGMTPSLTIRWLNHEGNTFDLPDLTEEEGGEYWLEWEWEKANTLSGECTEEARTDAGDLGAIRPSNLEQHGSDGQWGFHFRADHAGQDRIRFKLMHNHSDPHEDFISGWMDVTVADDEHELIDENGIYLHNRDRCRTR